MELAIDLEELMKYIALIYVGLGLVCLCIDVFTGWLGG